MSERHSTYEGRLRAVDMALKNPDVSSKGILDALQEYSAQFRWECRNTWCPDRVGRHYAGFPTEQALEDHRCSDHDGHKARFRVMNFAQTSAIYQCSCGREDWSTEGEAFDSVPQAMKDHLKRAAGVEG